MGYRGGREFGKLTPRFNACWTHLPRTRSMPSHPLDRINVFSQELLENLYREYLADPQQVAAEWRDFFDREAAAINEAYRQSPRFTTPSSMETI